MRIVKGKLKLDKRDTRVGNFVFTLEPEYVKVQDISQTVAHRIARHLPRGRMLEMMLEDSKEHEKALQNYAVVSFCALSVIPDAQFFEDIYRAAGDCVERHKEFYGVKDDITAEEDADILNEEREFHESVEEIGAVIGGGDA